MMFTGSSRGLKNLAKLVVLAGKVYRRKWKRKQRRELEKRWRKANKHRARESTIIKIEDLSDAEFTRMFRLDRPTFSYLLEKITPHIVVDEKKANDSPGLQFALVGGRVVFRYLLWLRCI